MKRKGRHPDKALTALGVRALKEPGRYADGNGLYLVVDPSGSKRWLLRTVAQGRRRDMGLGSASLVSLAEARELAVRHRKIAREGGDPIQARKSEKVAVPTFAEAVEQVHADHTAGWRNDKHAAQWINTLRTYAIPLIGDRLVNSIETPDILTVLSPIWLTRPETARRVRQRLKVILDWAKTAGHRSGENPVLGVDRGLPKQPKKSGHHKALPYDQTPAFVKALRMQNAAVTTKHAFEFLILTAGRTGEVLGAMWSEVDQAAKVWTIPAERMKAGRPHRVPLSARCLDILAETKRAGGSQGYVFKGAPDRPLSGMVFLMMLRRMEVDATAHGFRSAFSDWAAETTSFPREVVEMALAHTVENKVEAAYRRGDLFEKRRELMKKWEQYLTMI